jgi:putative transposase
MKFDRNRHHRRSIRLPDYDYRSAGAYFITIVSADRDCLFEQLALRSVVEQCWLALPRHFTHATLDVWVVMPNHVHGVVVLDSSLSRGEASPINSAPAHASAREFAAGSDVCLHTEMPRSYVSLQPGSLGAIVGNFKSVTTRRINRIRRTPGVAVWQRNYYERVVRNGRELQRMRNYIAANPVRWTLDRENPQQGEERDEWTADEDTWFGLQT